jgi:dTDP-4-amino-4,6-dideoxygalactose transaminase
MIPIPFNKPYMTGKELDYIKEAYLNSTLAGNGNFTKRCQTWFETTTQTPKVLLTHSCTAALEMTSILADLSPGDEVIMPSYTFVSTANAFALRQAVPVFVDIRSDTLNLDETKIESAITAKTRAIVPVHYAGVACEMDTIMQIAAKHNLLVIEDAAQGVMASYKERALGSIGHLGAYSFHETKNIISGEGGALLVNDPQYSNLAEIIWEKGTDRSRFFRGEVDKYTWQHIGSSFLPGEVVAAFLWAQIEHAHAITQQRIKIWNRYHQQFESLETAGYLRRPIVPAECQHNAHMYYLLLPSEKIRDHLLTKLKELGIHAIFHYIPLHSSPAGEKLGRFDAPLTNTDKLSKCLLRLPLWHDILDEQIDYIVEKITLFLKELPVEDKIITTATIPEIA